MAVLLIKSLFKTNEKSFSSPFGFVKGNTALIGSQEELEYGDEGWTMVGSEDGNGMGWGYAN